MPETKRPNLNAKKKLSQMTKQELLWAARAAKITVPEVLPLTREIYSRHSAGCCLHIVLSDLNIKDEHVKFCIEFARENGHGDCETLGHLLLRMSKSQRSRLENILSDT